MRTFLIAFMIRRQRGRQDWMIIMHKISTGKIHHVSALFALSDLIQQMGFHLLFWADINSFGTSRRY